LSHIPSSPSESVLRPMFDVDIPCFVCRYNLRSIPWEGNCPECGSPVRRSLDGGWLHFANEKWLRRIRLGVDLAIATVALAFVLFVAWMIFLVAHMAKTQGQPEFEALFLGVFVIAAVLGAVVSIVMWLLTTPEPVPADRGANARRSKLAGWTLGLFYTSLGAGIVSMAVFFSRFDPMAPPEFSVSQIPAHIAGWYSQIGYTVAWFLLLVYLRRIARRDMDGGLAKLMSFLVWGYVALVAVAALLVVVWTVWLWTGGAAQMQAMAASMPASGPAGSAGPVIWTVPGTPATQPWATTGPFWATTMTASGPTSMPAPPPAFVTGIMAAIVPVILVECFAFAWLIAAVVAVFWFRRMLTRAISNHVRLIPAA